MIDVGAIARFHRAQLALLATTYNSAWVHGVKSYVPDADPTEDERLPADPGHAKVLAVVGAGGVAAILHARAQPYRAPSTPDPSLMNRAVSPAVKSVDRMAAELQQVIANHQQLQAAEDAIRAGTIPAEDLATYALGLAAREWTERNSWRLTAGESVAWAGEQAGYGQAAEADGQLLEWVTEADDHVCEDCESLGALPPMPLSEWPTLPGMGDTICNVGCFLPGTRIAGRVLRAVRSVYMGQAVELVLASGKRLAVTPNHPVLTPDGLIAASDLRDGEYVVTDSHQIEMPRSVAIDVPSDHKQHDPVLVEQLFRSLTQLGPTRFAQPRREDLHGDAVSVKGKIEVVDACGVLLHNRRAWFQKLGEHILVDALMGDPSLTSTRLGLTVANHSPRRGCPRLSQLALHGSTVGLHRSPLRALRFGSAAQLDAHLRESSAENAPVNPRFLAQCVERLSGSVAPDKVTQVRHFDYAGHVFDVESPLGWVTANGIYCSNCRCVLQVSDVQLVPGGELPSLSEDQAATVSRIAAGREEELEPALA